MAGATIPKIPTPIYSPPIDVAIDPSFTFPNYPQAPKDIYNGAGGIGYTGEGGSGSPRQDLQTTATPEGAPIRVTYGRDRIGADVPDLFVYNNMLIIFAVWGDGPYEQIEAVYLGDALFTGTVRHYLNNSPVDDSVLATRTKYRSSTTGLAFSVLEVDTSYALDSLDVVAVIKGRNDVYDPRLSGGAGGSAHTETPALIVGHFATNFLSATANNSDLGSSADFNEEVLDPLTGNYVQDRGRYRSIIGITFDKFADKARVFATLKDLAQVYTAYEGDTLRMFPNKDGPSVGAITPSQIIEGSATKQIPSLSKSPNVVTVVGTSAADDGLPWEDQTFSTPTPASGAIREQQVRIPAIQSLALLQRVAKQRLNFYTIIQLKGKFKTRDESIKYLAGNLVDLTDTEGASAKKVRILNCPATGKGEWTIDWIEHDAAAYSDTYVSEPSVPDSSLPSPKSFPTPVSPDSITEKLFTDGSANTVTVFDIVWTGSPWPWVQNYRVRMKAGSTYVFDYLAANLGDGAEHRVTSPPTSPGVEYTVEIWIINIYGRQAPTGGSGTQTGAGNTIPPSDPSGMSGREANQFVALEWSASVDSNLRGYKIKKLNQSDYDAAADAAARWSHANAEVVVERIDSTKIPVPNQAVGAFYYMVKAEDFDGNYSSNFSAVLINVTEDQAASVITTQLDQATLVNMHLYDSRRQEGVNGGDVVVTSSGETWVDMFGAAGSLWTGNFSAGDRWIENLNVASSVESAEWDTTKDNSGNWIFGINHTVWAGVVTYTSMLSKAAAYPTFTSITGQSINGEGRYYKTKIAVAAGLGNGFTATLKFACSFAGVTLRNEGEESVLATGQPVTVTFATAHGVPPKVTCQLLGTTPGYALPNNITATDFDLEVWDTGGTHMAGTVQWISEGP